MPESFQKRKREVYDVVIGPHSTKEKLDTVGKHFNDVEATIKNSVRSFLTVNGEIRSYRDKLERVKSY